MDQFESRQKPREQVAQGSKVEPRPATEALTQKTSKLNLNIAPQKSERARDPVQLSTGKKVSSASGADQQFVQQQSTDQEFIDKVTLVIREALTHPVGGRAQDNARLVQDRQRLDQAKEVRKTADLQATRTQQGLDTDKQQQQQQRQQQQKQGTAAERAVQGAAQQDRASNKPGIDVTTRVAVQQSIRENIERNIVDSARQSAEALKEQAERADSAKLAQGSALAERNASKEGLTPIGTQDLVRGMTDGTQQRGESKLPQVAELSTGAALAVSLTTVEQARQAERRDEIYREIVRADERVAAVYSQLEERRDDELEEEDSIFERKITRRRLTRRVLQKLKRKQKRLTPLERRKLKLKADKERRLRKRRQKKGRLLVFTG